MSRGGGNGSGGFGGSGVSGCISGGEVEGGNGEGGGCGSVLPHAWLRCPLECSPRALDALANDLALNCSCARLDA
eukprot:scaffold56273_cov42-Phaeocystis_antarctica.AAC.1